MSPKHPGLPIKPPRPGVLVVGRVRARVQRGPRDDGRWYWCAERYANSTSTVVWIGWGTADEVEREVAAIVADRRDRAEVAVDPGDVRTVFDLLDTWAAVDAERSDVKPRTKIVHGAGCRRIVRTGLPILDVRLDRLDRRAMEAFRDARLLSGAAPNTVLQDVILIGQAWRWAREIGAAPDHEPPRCLVKVPKIDRNVPTPAIIGAVLADLDKHSPPWCGRGVRLIAATGARRNEIGALRWCDVFVDRDARGKVRGAVLRLDGKTGPRRVPLHPAVAAEVATWRPADARPEDRVLGVTVGTVQTYLLDRVYQACARLGLEPFRLHDIRASVVGALYRTGADPSAAAAIAGHSAKTALMFYRKVSDEDLAAAVERAALGILPADKVEQRERKERPEQSTRARRPRPA